MGLKKKTSLRAAPSAERLFVGGSDRVYRAIQSALIELDKVAKDCEAQWGIDRLPELVGPELRERFEAQGDRLDEAIARQDVDAVRHEAEVMARAWQALERAAKGAGARELTGEGFEGRTSDGRVVRVCRDIHEASKAMRDQPGLVAVGADEVAALWGLWEGARLVERAKATFPGAKVVATNYRESLDDEIPF